MDRFFGISAQGSTVRTEVAAGVTTFLTMAYIMFLNPTILGDAGMDKGAVFVATCLASAFATLIMAFYANYPIALAPGMGINAFFTYGVVLGMHYSWQTALGAVFISGVLFLVLSLTPLREWIIDGIPKSQKMAVAAGIGLFLGVLALEKAGVIAADKETYVTLGNLHAPAVILAALGFVAMAALEARRVPAQPGADLPAAGPQKQFQPGGDHRRSGVLFRRFVRFDRHADRRRPSGRTAETRRHTAAAAQGAAGGFAVGAGGCGARHLAGDVLYRECRGC